MVRLCKTENKTKWDIPVHMQSCHQTALLLFLLNTLYSITQGGERAYLQLLGNYSFLELEFPAPILLSGKRVRTLNSFRKTYYLASWQQQEKFEENFTRTNLPEILKIFMNFIQMDKRFTLILLEDIFHRCDNDMFKDTSCIYDNFL